MVNIKLKRFSRSKEQLPEDVQSEPQPDSPSQLQTETQIKKSRGRPKKNKVDDVPQQQQPPQTTPEPTPEPEPEPEPQPIDYDDVSNDNFLDDLNNVNYTEVIPETKKPIKEDVKQIIKPTSSFSLDSNKLLDKIKKSSSTSSPSNFSLDSHSLLDKIKKNQKTDKPAVNNDFDTSMFSQNGSEILGREKRILLTKIRQYKSLFPDTFKTFKIKANASAQELQTYLDEMDSIVECDSVEQFLLDSILQCIKLIEGVSSYTKYDIQGLADLLKANKQFHQLSKQLFIKYKVFNAVPPELQMVMLVSTTAYIVNSKNKRKGELESYLNQPLNIISEP